MLPCPPASPAVFVDGQASQVAQLMLWSAGCYTATALFYSFKAGLQVYNQWPSHVQAAKRLAKLVLAQPGCIRVE